MAPGKEINIESRSREDGSGRKKDKHRRGLKDARHGSAADLKDESESQGSHAGPSTGIAAYGTHDGGNGFVGRGDGGRDDHRAGEFTGEFAGEFVDEFGGDDGLGRADVNGFSYNPDTRYGPYRGTAAGKQAEVFDEGHYRPHDLPGNATAEEPTAPTSSVDVSYNRPATGGRSHQNGAGSGQHPDTNDHRDELGTSPPGMSDWSTEPVSGSPPT